MPMSGKVDFPTIRTYKFVKIGYGSNATFSIYILLFLSTMRKDYKAMEHKMWRRNFFKTWRKKNQIKNQINVKEWKCS
jgi:hypothetical protein